MGQTEAPLTIRPFLPEMTNRSSDRDDVRDGARLRRHHGRVNPFGIEAKHLLTAVIRRRPARS
jgi:hypothetical protein